MLLEQPETQKVIFKLHGHAFTAAMRELSKLNLKLISGNGKGVKAFIWVWTDPKPRPQASVTFVISYLYCEPVTIVTFRVQGVFPAFAIDIDR